jgi:hypothetical protein
MRGARSQAQLPIAAASWFISEVGSGVPRLNYGRGIGEASGVLTVDGENVASRRQHVAAGKDVVFAATSAWPI